MNSSSSQDLADHSTPLRKGRYKSRASGHDELETKDGPIVDDRLGSAAPLAPPDFPSLAVPGRDRSPWDPGTGAGVRVRCLLWAVLPDRFTQPSGPSRSWVPRGAREVTSSSLSLAWRGSTSFLISCCGFPRGLRSVSLLFLRLLRSDFRTRRSLMGLFCLLRRVYRAISAAKKFLGVTLALQSAPDGHWKPSGRLGGSSLDAG